MKTVFYRELEVNINHFQEKQKLKDKIHAIENKNYEKLNVLYEL